MSPTDCVEPPKPEVIESVCMTTGGNILDVIPMPEGAISVNKQDFSGDTIDFIVNQQWISDKAGLAIEAGMDACIIKGNVTFGDSENVQGECYDGSASVLVVVYMDDDFEPDECEACNVDDLSDLSGNNTFCAYRVEIPCEPVSVECGEPSAVPSDAPTLTPTASPSSSPIVDTDSPPPTSCPPSDPILIANDGETMYPDLPVTITHQNTTHVAFTVENTFGSTVSSVFTEYHSGSFGETECLEEENVEHNSQVEIEFVAQCMHHAKISVVNVWVTDCDETLPFLDQADNAEVPECCHPGWKQCRTVQYTFKLPCVSPCPDDEVSVVNSKSLALNGGTAGPPIGASPVNGGPPIVGPPVNTGNENNSEGIKEDLTGRKEPFDDSTGNEGGARRNLATTMKEEESTEEFKTLTGYAEPNNSEEEGHFCVVEDYPCGNSNDETVYVCHYSARDGYKTFCVPEPDSDALRFYPKDYCGPCVGWVQYGIDT